MICFLTPAGLNAETFDYPEVSINEINGGDTKDNAQIILDLFRDKKRNGIFYTVCANAAVALYAAGISDNLLDCKNTAENSILDGTAYEKLNNLIEF